MIGRKKNVQAISKMRMTFNFPSITKMRRSFAIYFLRKIFEGYSNIYIFYRDDISINISSILFCYKISFHEIRSTYFQYGMP